LNNLVLPNVLLAQDTQMHTTKGVERVLQHFSNCHGELNLLFALLTSVPFLGMWIGSLRKNINNSSDQ